MRLIGAIVKSDVFLVVATRNYLEAIKNDPNIYDQIQIARQHKKPVLFLMDRQMTEEERREIKKHFDGMDIIGEISFDSNIPDSINGATSEVKEVVEQWVSRSRTSPT